MAKYGQFETYEPAPDVAPDAFRFTLGDGKKVLASGTAAENLRKRLDAYDAGTRVAGDQAGAAFAPPSDGAGVNPFTGQPYQGGAPAPTAPPAQQGPGGELGYGLSVNQAGQIVERKVVPGQKAITKEDLQQAEADKVTAKQGQTEVVQAGTPASEEFLANESALRQAETDNLNKLRRDEAAMLEAESGLAADRFVAAKRLEGEEAARLADLQKRFAIEEDAAKRAREEYTSSKVEPGRIFANPLKRMAAALAGGAGAYAATIAKTPNFAQQLIDQAIDRDIRAQEAQIKLKGEKAGNLMADLRARGMSVEQSRATAKQIQLQAEQRAVELARSKNAIPERENHYNNLSIALQKSWNEADEARRLAGQDKVTRSVQSGFASPRAGTAGGVVEVAVKDQLGTAKKIQELKKGEQDLANPKGPTASPEKRMAAGAQAEAGVLRDIASGYPDDKEVATYETQWFGGRIAEDLADYVAGKGAGVGPQTAKERQDFARVQAGLGSAASQLGGQGSMTGDEQKTFAAGMAPGATWGEVKRATEMLAARASARGIAAEQAGEAGGTVMTK